MAEFSAGIIAHQKKRKCLAALVINELLNDGKNTRKPRGKTRAWIRRRSGKGSFNNIVQELMIEDTAGYKEMMRMNYGHFCEIVNSSFCSAICGVILLSFFDLVLLLDLRHFELFSSTSTPHARMQYNALQVEWCVQTSSTL